jgi:hypothetical protein
MHVNVALLIETHPREQCGALVPSTSSGVPLSSSDEKCCRRFCQSRRCRSPGWASSLVDGSRRGAVAIDMMSMQNQLTKDTSPPAPRVVIVIIRPCVNEPLRNH